MRTVITDQQLQQVRTIAEWALEHTVALPEDASTLTERGLDTGLPLVGEGAPFRPRRPAGQHQDPHHH